jgi:AhpD family alkylhydroperoxidase
MIKYITPVAPEAASGLLGDIYNQIRHDFGAVVEPFAVHSISPRLLAAVWSVCRESDLVGVVPRQIKEAVAVTISKMNRCSYCVDAHLVMLHALKAHSTARELEHDRFNRLSDYAPSLFAGAGAMCAPRPPAAFTGQEIPEMIGTAVFFQYINRMVTILLDDTPLPFSQRWLRGLLMRGGGWFHSFAARRPKTPGDSLAFLPDVPLPDDLAWASASPALSGALARLSHEIEQQGHAALPSETITFASEFIQKSEIEAHCFDRASVELAIQHLNPAQSNSARLVLLTALAPHEVDEKVIRAFADPAQDQEKLLGALSWASFTAARQIGSWLAAGAASSSSSLGMSLQ